jgi:hypothetical protein
MTWLRFPSTAVDLVEGVRSTADRLAPSAPAKTPRFRRGGTVVQRRSTPCPRGTSAAYPGPRRGEGNALLAVEQQLDHARRQQTVTPWSGGLGFGGPHQQTADRMPAVERIEQPMYLVAVPKHFRAGTLVGPCDRCRCGREWWRSLYEARPPGKKVLHDALRNLADFGQF